MRADAADVIRCKKANFVENGDDVLLNLPHAVATPVLASDRRQRRLLTDGLRLLARAALRRADRGAGNGVEGDEAPDNVAGTKK